LEHGVSEKGSSVTVNVSNDGPLMKASVIDDGAGIPDDFSLEKNTNLGLQIVQTLTLNELAGSIEFIKPEEGTEVRITFPITR
jgi:two-component sensor histidine kinase